MKTQAYTILHRDGYLWFTVAYEATKSGNLKAECRLFTVGNQVALRHCFTTSRSDKNKIGAVLYSFGQTAASLGTHRGHTVGLQFTDVIDDFDWRLGLKAGGHQVIQTIGD